MTGVVVSVLLVSLVGNSVAFPTMQSTAKDLFTLIGKAMFQQIESENGEPIPKLAEHLGATKYVEYLQKAGLMETLSEKGPFTAFAFTNEGYDQAYEYKKRFLKNDTMMKDMMQYTILTETLVVSEIKNEMMVPTMMGGEYKMRFNIYHDGTVMTAAGMKITMADKKAENGVVQVVDGVMMPPFGPVFKALTICPVFKTFIKVLGMADMKEMMNSDGPFTVFAPTDKAFDKIPKETLEHLMKNTAVLKHVLMSHIVKGTYYSAGFSEDHPLTTETGMTLKLKTENHKFMVNTVPMIYVDGTVSNGVVHAIDAVLMPPTAQLELVFEE